MLRDMAFKRALLDGDRSIFFFFFFLILWDLAKIRSVEIMAFFVVIFWAN